MTTTSTAKTIRSRTSAARRGGGFAFTEVLFAVMVLGLGFIMIAAMFPVTIRQTQSTLEETVGANVARGAVEYLQGAASEDLFPPTVQPLTGIVPPQPDLSKQVEFVSLRDVKLYAQYNAGTTPLSWGKPDPDPTKYSFFPALNTIKGNMIDATDPRLAWVPFYRREPGSPFAQVIVIAVRNRERDRYVASMNPLYAVNTASGPRMYSDLDRPTATPTMPGTLEPVRVPIGLNWNISGHGEVTFDMANAPLSARAATGAYLVVAADPVAHTAPNTPGQLIGRIFQLGNPIDEAAGRWELSPAGDMIRANPDVANPQIATDDPNCPLAASGIPTDSVQAYLIGRGYVDPSDGGQGFAGPAQDIAVYTGFISIPPRTTP
jgi:hypothetical protein